VAGPSPFGCGTATATAAEPELPGPKPSFYLDHEVGDDPVEGTPPLVVQRLAGHPNALLAGAQRTEVLHRLGHRISKQPDGVAAKGGTVSLNVENDLAGDVLRA